MKKILAACALCLAFSGAFAQEELLLVNPWRETFVQFPSRFVGNSHRVTFFLPEESVPLRQAYPVVYLLNAGPEQKEQARAWLAASQQKALVVGLDFTEEDLRDADAAVRFFSQELLPYVDTNYYTLARPSARVIGGAGEQAARVVNLLAANPDLFSAAVLIHPGTDASFAQFSEGQRVFLRADAEQAGVWQEELSRKGLTYGNNFVYRLEGSEQAFDNLPLEYLFASAEAVQVRRATARPESKTLSLAGDSSVRFLVRVVLNNGMEFDFLPSRLHFEPASLLWNPFNQTLAPAPGASAGTVKISGVVDKKPFKTKIKLKKQEK